jgi:hypothetical protein
MANLQVTGRPSTRRSMVGALASRLVSLRRLMKLPARLGNPGMLCGDQVWEESTTEDVVGGLLRKLGGAFATIVVVLGLWSSVASAHVTITTYGP